MGAGGREFESLFRDQIMTRLNICPKGSTPYFAMGAKSQHMKGEFESWCRRNSIGAVNWFGTNIVEFEQEEDLTFFLMTWQHEYEVIK